MVGEFSASLSKAEDDTMKEKLEDDEIEEPSVSGISAQAKKNVYPEDLEIWFMIYEEALTQKISLQNILFVPPTPSISYSYLEWRKVVPGCSSWGSEKRMLLLLLLR